MFRWAHIMAFLILAVGCVSQTEASFENHAGKIISKDIDSDGFKEYHEVVFGPEKSGDIMVFKKVKVYSMRKVSDLNLSEIGINQQKLIEAKDEMESALRTCSERTGLDKFECIGIENCASLCEKSSKECADAVKRLGREVVGFEVSEYSELLSGFEKSIDSAYKKSSVYGMLSPSQKFTSALDINKAFEDANRIETSLIMDKDFGLCAMPSTDWDIHKVVSGKGMKRTQEKYIYSVAIKVFSEYGEDTHKTFEIKDRIPEESAGSISSSNHLEIEGNEAVFKIPQGEDGSVIVAYSFESFIPPESIGLYAPKVRMESTWLFFLKPTIAIYGYMIGMFGKEVSFSMSIMVPIIFLLVVYNLVNLTYLRITKGKKGFQKAVSVAFSKSGRRWKGDLILSLVLLLMAFAISMNFPDRNPKTFNFRRISESILSSPTSIVTFFLFSVGIYLAYSVVEEFLKNRIYITAKSELIAEKKKMAKKLFADLEMLMESARKTEKEAEEMGIDIKEEKEVLQTVPMSILKKEVMEEKANEGEIEKYISIVQNAESDIKMKISKAKEGFEEWKRKIVEILEKNGSVKISGLTFIPHYAREWAVDSIISDDSIPMHLTVSNGRIVKEKVNLPKEAKKIFEHGLAETIIIEKSGTSVSAFSRIGKATVQRMLFLKSLDYARSYAKEKEKGLSYIYSIGESLGSAVIIKGDVQVMIVSKIEVFKECIEGWKKVLSEV